MFRLFFRRNTKLDPNIFILDPNTLNSEERLLLRRLLVKNPQIEKFNANEIYEVKYKGWIRRIKLSRHELIRTKREGSHTYYPYKYAIRSVPEDQDGLGDLPPKIGPDGTVDTTDPATPINKTGSAKIFMTSFLTPDIGGQLRNDKQKERVIKVQHYGKSQSPEKTKDEVKIANQSPFINMSQPTIVKQSESSYQSFIVMDKLGGENLSEFLIHYGLRQSPDESLSHFLKRRDEDQLKLSFDVRFEIAIQILRAVQELHSLGIIHLDLKADNIRIKKDANGNYKILIFDFGEALLKDKTGLYPKKEIHAQKGNPTYAPKEQQVTGETILDEKSDAYTIGKVLSELFGMPHKSLNPSNVPGKFRFQIIDELVAKNTTFTQGNDFKKEFRSDQIREIELKETSDQRQKNAKKLKKTSKQKQKDEQKIQEKSNQMSEMDLKGNNDRNVNKEFDYNPPEEKSLNGGNILLVADSIHLTSNASLNSQNPITVASLDTNPTLNEALNDIRPTSNASLINDHPTSRYPTLSEALNDIRPTSDASLIDNNPILSSLDDNDPTLNEEGNLLLDTFRNLTKAENTERTIIDEALTTIEEMKLNRQLKSKNKDEQTHIKKAYEVGIETRKLLRDNRKASLESQIKIVKASLDKVDSGYISVYLDSLGISILDKKELTNKEAVSKKLDDISKNFTTKKAQLDDTVKRINGMINNLKTIGSKSLLLKIMQSIFEKLENAHKKTNNVTLFNIETLTTKITNTLKQYEDAIANIHHIYPTPTNSENLRLIIQELLTKPKIESHKKIVFWVKGAILKHLDSTYTKKNIKEGNHGYLQKQMEVMLNILCMVNGEEPGSASMTLTDLENNIKAQLKTVPGESWLAKFPFFKRFTSSQLASRINYAIKQSSPSKYRNKANEQFAPTTSSPITANLKVGQKSSS